VKKKDFFVVDAHCDTLSELKKTGESLQTNNLHISLDSLQQYGGYIQLFAAWVDDACKNPLDEALALVEVFYTQLTLNQKVMHQVLGRDDLKKAFDLGKVGAMLAVENGNVLGGCLENVYRLYQLGVRAMTLTWNGKNELGVGSLFCDEEGLSPFGVEVVHEMNRLGMIVDVSHLSEQGFWDVLMHSSQPVMASHSNAKTVTPHKRNLSDEQICALVQMDGFIGLNLYPDFLTGKKTADLDDCVRHIAHMVELGAELSLGLGSDFDGVTCLPQGLSGAGDYDKLFNRLLQKGYSDTFIHNITHKNFLRFAEQVLHEHITARC